MPDRILTNTETSNSIVTWLNQNLQNPFRASIENLPHDDNSRGIYFWFMKPEGYQRLSLPGLNITAVNPTYNMKINEKTHDLVYVGTAGVNRNESSTIIKRLNWHLSNSHNKNNICNGTLSTLRQTVGATLSDDLIIPNTEIEVNEFFSDYFYIYTLPYSGEANNKERIENDEYTLISVLKPLFNIKNNPNARILAGQHPTRKLKERRGLVIRNTRERLGCKNEDDEKPNPEKNENKPPKSPLNNYELIYDKDGCQEFTVTMEQSIHEIVSGIEDLPTSRCEIVIYNSANPDEFVYKSKHNNGKRVTGDKKTSIYGYFNNVDTNKNNQPRWKLIQQEMLEKGIEEITIRVFRSELEIQSKVYPNKGLKYPKQNKTIINIIDIPEQDIRKEDIIVICCAGRKNPLFRKLTDNEHEIDFRAVSNPVNYEYIPDDIKSNNQTWREYIHEHQANTNLNIYNAYMLYTPKSPFQNIYSDLYARFSNQLYILSAGWGLIKSDYRIPKYDITFKSDKPSNKRTEPNPIFDQNDWKQLSDNELKINSRIIFIGPPSYHRLFDRCTTHLNNQKIKIEINSVRGVLQDFTNRTWYYHFLSLYL